jgi:xeroderma pigmentosum group C-complementing protein
MPRGEVLQPSIVSPGISDGNQAVDVQASNFPFASSPSLGISAPRRRLGHPNAADYNLPTITAPVRAPHRSKVKEIHESPYPIFWLEVLDRAHQKWIPVDPLVTHSVGKPQCFEPPASDRENNMSYVVAFDEEGTARDITRRYAKAYNAKTRKFRVESTPGGEKWWRKTMERFSRGWQTDIEQIEDGELVAAEARESMPKNVADFKDHPYYALERHLRRNEVLIGKTIVGKVAVGRDPEKPGLKKLENIYRRRDVKVVKSSGAWYRLGRDIKIGEQPTKTIAAKRRVDEDDLDDDTDERAVSNLYTEDQTEPCKVPPVVDGQVPKNSYGNLDIFVPSMIPVGGIHIPGMFRVIITGRWLLTNIDDEASRVARLLGIDYADALTGFEFRGRHGTAILKGIVVAVEYKEAVETVIEGLQDEKAQFDENMRSLAALRMWKRFMTGLRIKERVDAYKVEGEDSEEDDDFQEEEGEGMESEEYEDDGGGGFIPE